VPGATCCCLRPCGLDRLGTGGGCAGRLGRWVARWSRERSLLSVRAPGFRHRRVGLLGAENVGSHDQRDHGTAGRSVWPAGIHQLSWTNCSVTRPMCHAKLGQVTEQCPSLLRTSGQTGDRRIPEHPRATNQARGGESGGRRPPARPLRRGRC
jgi:hypothetical protein